MNRKPQLKTASALLQNVVEQFQQSGEKFGHAHALSIIAQLEGMEGYRQLKAQLELHREQAKVDAGSHEVHTRTLAMVLYGHFGYQGLKPVINNLDPVVGLLPVTDPSPEFWKRQSMLYVVPRGPQLLRICDWDAVALQADLDAGAPKVEQADDTTTVFTFQNFSRNSVSVTLGALKAAKYLGEGVWEINSQNFKLLKYSQMVTPGDYAPFAYDPKAMTEGEFWELQRELEGHQMSHARGEDTERTYSRMDQIESILKQSPWEIDMDTSRAVLKAEVSA